MKPRIQIHTLGLALLLLPVVSTFAAPAYVRQELFEQVQSFQTGDKVRFLSTGSLNGSGPTRLLNNRGEVIYLYGSLSTSQPGLWLPSPNYGLPAGLNDLKAFRAVNRIVEVFGDDGRFATIVQLPHGFNDPPANWYQVFAGTAAGESLLAKTLTYDPLSPRVEGNSTLYRRHLFATRGVSTDGLPFGEAQVQLNWEAQPDSPLWVLSSDPRDFADSGFFLGVPLAAQVSLIPGIENAPDCPPTGPGSQRSTFLRAASPNGTVVTFANDQCGNVFTGVTALNKTLAVISRGGTRTISVRRSGAPVPDPDPNVAGPFVVNDAGVVAGIDGKGLWLSPDAGPFTRSGVTDATSIQIDAAGDVWFASQSNISKWTLSGIYSLELPWAAWGYTGDPYLLSANKVGQLLVLGSQPGGKSYAVLLSLALTVDLTVSTDDLSVGDQFIANVTVQNPFDIPLHDVFPSGPLDIAGDGEVQILDGPTPVTPQELGPHGTAAFAYRFEAVKAGSVGFSAVVSARDDWGSVHTGEATCRIANPAGVAGLAAISAPSGANAPPKCRNTVTIHSGLIVTTTGDEDITDAMILKKDYDLEKSRPGLQLTLRAAIRIANATQSGTPIQIGFNLPAEAGALIRPRTALPVATRPVTIDGSTQPGYAGQPVVQLSGLEAPPGTSGLAIAGGNSVVRGLVIKEFDADGIVLMSGPGDVVEGNYIGTSLTGNAARPNGGDGIRVLARGCTIGGSALAQRNLISGNAGNGVRIVTAGGGKDARMTRVLGNDIGIVQGPIRGNGRNGIFVLDANVIIGGSAPDEGNAICASGQYGIHVKAYSPVVIQGNFIGTDRSETGVFLGNDGSGIKVGGGSRGCQIGGLQPNQGNVIVSSGERLRSLRGADGIELVSSDGGHIVQGNYVGVTRSGGGPDAVLFANSGYGIWVSIETLIGGVERGAGNIISGNGMDGVLVAPSGRATIQGNWIGVLPDGALRKNFGNGVFCLGSRASTIGGLTPGQGNRIVGNGHYGVRVKESAPVSIRGNSIVLNGVDAGIVDRGSGISLAEGVGESHGSPQSGRLRSPPTLLLATTEAGEITIQGELETTPGTLFEIDCFANRQPDPSGVGQGETYLASKRFESSLTEQRTRFQYVMRNAVILGVRWSDFAVPTGWFVTAVATRFGTGLENNPVGDSSEFSRALTLQGPTLTRSGVSAEVQNQAPPPLGGAPAPLALSALQSRAGKAGPLPRTGLELGDGNGDGTLDSQQLNVCSLPGFRGKWITIATPDGTALEDVSPSGPPDFEYLPAGYTFPVGFVSFSVTGLALGGTASVTNIFHDPIEHDTVFAFGPTPDNRMPHWYEIIATGSGDEIRFNLTDGGRGDHDLKADGKTTTILAPAYKSPPGPQLRLVSTSVEVVDLREFTEDSTDDSVVTTNQVPLVTSVLTWPAAATNWSLEFADALSPTNFWRNVPDKPVEVNDQNVITNVAAGGSRFYQLRATSSGDAGLTPEQLAQGTYSWTGTGVWSDSANWNSTSLAGGAPLTNGLQIIDVVFPAGGSPITSVVDGPYAVRSLAIPVGAPSVDLQSSGATASLTLGVGGLVQQSAGSTTIQPPVTLAVDQTWLIEAGTLTVASLNLGSHSLTVTGAGRLIVQDLAGGATSRFTASGSGQVELSDAVPASSFRGTLAVAGGSVTSSQAALNFASAVELSGGTLNLPLNAILSSTTAWRVSGGEIVVNGASGNLGPLQSSGAAALRLGSGTGSLTFASATLANANGQLTVYDWQGAGGTAGTGRRVFVQTAPAAAWLTEVNFVGATFDTGALRLASGEIVPIPKPPSVLPANALVQFQAYGTGLTKTIVAVSGQTFSQAMRIDTTQKPAQVYNSGVTLHTSEAVAANDNLLARFWIRRVAPASGSARVQFNFELASGSFDKSVQFPVTLNDDQWQLKSVKFKSRAAYSAGAAEVSFWAGYGVQTVEIGGLEVLNYQGTPPP